jgi:SAM-dependent methyltransferase
VNYRSLALLCCPHCRGELALDAGTGQEIIYRGLLRCQGCGRSYPIRKGIPEFIHPGGLAGFNRKYETLYNLISPFYDSGFFIAARVRNQFWPAGEDKARQEIVERLEIRQGCRVLETGIGTGSNIPYLLKATPDLEIYGLDISPGMLAQCTRQLKVWGLEADLSLGNAEDLPFQDQAFDVVFHVGGINAFTDIGRAVEEMIRVARPGTRIVIADENEAVFGDVSVASKLGSYLFFGKRMAEEIFAFRTEDMLQSIPDGMQEVGFHSIWEGKGYLLEFRTP